MATGDDSTLIKVAVFGVAFSIIATMGLAVLFLDGGQYDYDSIQGYRDDLIEFSGESMINQSPWVLEHVYTPWVPSYGVEGHMDKDGWLYGEELDNTEFTGGLGQSANIRLDPAQKSTVPISVSSEKPTYTYEDGYKWWADPDNFFSVVTKPIGEFFGNDPLTYAEGTASIWNFSGLRYMFLPTLPFAVADEDNPTNTSVKNGALNVVWYNYGGQEGISGGLQVYNGDVLLSSYSAADIVAGYNSTDAYATVYDFNFNGTIIKLSIRFDADVIAAGTPLMEAFTAGYWTMAISSTSAGNFYDVEDGVSFTSTAGSMIDTFVDIYTFDMPNVSNGWAKTVMWLLVGLPMTLAMLCVTLRLVSSIRVI